MHLHKLFIFAKISLFIHPKLIPYVYALLEETVSRGPSTNDYYWGKTKTDSIINDR